METIYVGICSANKRPVWPSASHSMTAATLEMERLREALEGLYHLNYTVEPRRAREADAAFPQWREFEQHRLIGVE